MFSKGSGYLLLASGGVHSPGVNVVELVPAWSDHVVSRAGGAGGGSGEGTLTGGGAPSAPGRSDQSGRARFGSSGIVLEFQARAYSYASTLI
jgi:hypothetical protein